MGVTRASMLWGKGALGVIGVASVAAALTAGWTTSADASGFAAARFGGEHGNPTESNPTALYYNPGGIGLSEGTNLTLDLSFVWRNVSYDRPTSAIDNPGDARSVEANSGENTVENFLISPMFGVTSDLGIEDSPLVLGAAFFAPFGGQAVWNEDDAFKGDTQYPGAVDGSQRWYAIEGTIRTLAFTVGAAYVIKPARLSFGLAGNLYLSDVNTIRARNGDGSDDLVTPTGALKEGRSYLNVSSTDFGLGAGVLWEAMPKKLWLGLSYQSQPGFSGDMVMKGTLNNLLSVAPSTETNVKFTQSLPDIIRAGGRFRPSPELELRLFADFIRWSVFDQQCVMEDSVADGDLADACALNADGSQKNADMTDPLLVLVRDWENAFGVRAGASYWLMERDLELIVGAGFDGNAVPDNRLEPALIDMDKFTASLGGRYQIAPQLAFTLTGTNVFYTERDTTGTATANGFANLSRPRQPGSDGIYNQNIFLINTNAELSF